ARGMFADLTADDAAAYTLYTEANKCEDETKAAKMATALAAAIDVPRQMAALAISVMESLIALGEHCNKYLLTDLSAAAILAEAVVRLSDYNVRVNAAGLTDKSAADDLREASSRDCKRAAELRQAVEKIVSEYV
ncbi:MAG: cyclodeaminase/cyclohydrolase family protein, partial [Phycisphaerae bacterium]|nr:cyclodeaminase/cyclohydrolase family protein [Phycisphaerae bacterium]